jgi:hypothetical protein
MIKYSLESERGREDEEDQRGQRDENSDDDDEILFYSQTMILSATIDPGVSNDLSKLISRIKNLIREPKEGNLLITLSPREKTIKISHRDSIDNLYCDFTTEADYQGQGTLTEDQLFLTNIESLLAETCRKNYDESTLNFSVTPRHKLMIKIAVAIGNISSEYMSERLCLYQLPERGENIHIHAPSDLKWEFSLSKDSSEKFIDLINLLYNKKHEEYQVSLYKVPNGFICIQYWYANEDNERPNEVRIELPYKNVGGNFNNNSLISWNYKSMGKFFKLILKNELKFTITKELELIISSEVNGINIRGIFERID